LTIHTALAIFRKGTGHYREFCALTLYHYPSESLLKKYEQSSRVKAGVDLLVYGKIATYMERNNLPHLDVILLFDEVKISAGISWNTFNHEITGFCDEEQDYASLLSELNGQAKKKTKLASYLNQWKIVSENTSFSCPVEFFSSSVPAKLDALISQLFHVLLMLENINVRVYALCSDAGTAHGKNFRLLRIQELPEKIGFDMEEHVSMFWHPFSDEPRKVFMYHCMVHGLKAVRNNLEKSRIDSTLICKTILNSECINELSLTPVVAESTSIGISKQVIKKQENKINNQNIHRQDFAASGVHCDPTNGDKFSNYCVEGTQSCQILCSTDKNFQVDPSANHDDKIMLDCSTSHGKDGFKKPAHMSQTQTNAEGGSQSLIKPKKGCPVQIKCLRTSKLSAPMTWNELEAALKRDDTRARDGKARLTNLTHDCVHLNP
jgi:hypothetical protein